MFFSNDGDLIAWIMMIPIISLYGFSMSNTDEPIYAVIFTGGLFFGMYSIYKFVSILKKNNYKNYRYDIDDYILDDDF
jgi:hypothetical protein